MRIRQLEFFVRASELRSISQAAEELNIAQTALGIQIRKLESEFNATLLTRTRRGVELTPAGEIFYEWSNDILQRYQVIRRQLSYPKTDITTLALGLTHSVIATAGAGIVQALSTGYPNLKLEIHEGHSHTILSELLAGNLDIGLVFTSTSDQSLISTPLLVEKLLLVSSPQEATAESTVSAEDLLSRPLVIPSDEEDVTRKILLQEAAALGVTPNITFEVQSISTMKQLVVNDLASAILPFGCVAEDFQAVRLRCQSITSRSFHRTLHVLRTRTTDDAVIELLSSVVRDGYDKLNLLIRQDRQ